jgi:hypothetical protein
VEHVNLMPGRLEVQGIVAMATGMPIVQCRMLGRDDEVLAEWQCEPMEAREHAQLMVEAAMNAVYDAALILWAKETWPDDELMGPRMVALVREHRADHWGLPDTPSDWRKST